MKYKKKLNKKTQKHKGRSIYYKANAYNEATKYILFFQIIVDHK